ncbi:hypothetical protein IE4872_PD01444 (plasmid) [Rhizobium gallicum]|uniref:Uncharacterized protein n=1 Tax=Rhizobium gallicum TaxID=56730 RepID=A0A1L5NVR0_9HYPH|nr:hypothetical protein IE4872_PD01444 [Rhizobium gallicum]
MSKIHRPPPCRLGHAGKVIYETTSTDSSTFARSANVRAFRQMASRARRLCRRWSPGTLPNFSSIERLASNGSTGGSEIDPLKASGIFRSRSEVSVPASHWAACVGCWAFLPPAGC